jgi:hypothetical protein
LNEKNVLRFLSVTEECPPEVLCPSALAIAAQNFETLLKVHSPEIFVSML